MNYKDKVAVPSRGIAILRQVVVSRRVSKKICKIARRILDYNEDYHTVLGQYQTRPLRERSIFFHQNVKPLYLTSIDELGTYIIWV